MHTVDIKGKFLGGYRKYFMFSFPELSQIFYLLFTFFKQFTEYSLHPLIQKYTTFSCNFSF